MSNFLKNKVIILTGASKGIGRATAHSLSKAGAKLILASRNKERLEELARELPNECHVIPTDVTREQEVINLFKETENRLGRLDILINNAGNLQYQDLTSTSLQEWNNVIEPNLTGVYLCTKEAILLMRKNHTKGKIITISSLLAFLGVANRASYCASKHGVSGLMKAVKKEVKKDKIKVITLHPAGVNTEMLNKGTVSRKLGSVLEPKDIGEYITSLASDSFTRKTLGKTRILAKRFSSFF